MAGLSGHGGLSGREGVNKRCFMGARKRRRRCDLLFSLSPLLFSLFPLPTRRQIKQARDLTRATPRRNELRGPDTRPEAPKPLAEEQKRKIELSFFKFSFRGLGSALEIQARTGKLGLGEQADGGARHGGDLFWI